MREYIIEEWGYTVNAFSRLAQKKKYAERVRLEYFQFAFGKNKKPDIFRNFINTLLGLVSELRYVFVYQVLKGDAVKIDSDILVQLSSNASFLKTIIPISEMLIEAKAKPLFFCQANHYKLLSGKLNPEISDHLIIQENVKVYNTRLQAFYYFTRSFMFTLWDMVWYAFQPVKRSFTTSFIFGKYAFINHYFNSYWKSYFTQSNRIFIAADDKYLWESLLFNNTIQTKSESYVFQHGKLGDIYYPTPANKFCAWGKMDMQILINDYKALPDQIIAIGSPYFDLVYNNIKAVNDFKASDKVYICFLGQPHYAMAATKPHYDQALSWFYQLSQNPKFKMEFVIKPHPHDKESYYDSRPETVKVVKGNIIEILEKSLIMVTVDSTSVLEASVTKSPSIQLLQSGSKTFSDESPTGICLKAETYEEFEALALKLYNDPDFYNKTVDNASKALHLYFTNLGQSLEKIKELLLSGESAH